MRQSSLFSKTRKEIISEDSRNAQLLLQAGFIDKLMSGVFTYLPLGLRVLNKINNIIRREVNKIGAQEILMPALTNKDLWVKTNRWDNFDALFKFEARKHFYALGATHEEVVTPLLQKFVFSYKDLPQAVYQIQTKFRNEARSKSGLLRGREFLMKDMYSFHSNEEDLNKFYKQVENAYENIWKALEIADITIKTYASGGAFSKYSHEYQVISDIGEDHIYYCPKCKVAINDEIIDDLDHKCPECGNHDLEEKNSIEVANIFKLKNKFSSAFKFTFIDEDSKHKDVLMGCYGIGPSRLMGTIVELFNDKNGILWPKNITPYQVHLLRLQEKDAELNNILIKKAEEIYRLLLDNNIEVLYDDRENSSNGEKFKDSDLIGIPLRLIISTRTLSENALELKLRTSNELSLIKLSTDFISEIKTKL